MQPQREHLLLWAFREIIANYRDGRWGQLGRDNLPGGMRSLARSWCEQEVLWEHKYLSKKELLPRVPPKYPQQGKDFHSLWSFGVIPVIIHTVSIFSRSVSQIFLLISPCSWKLITLCLPLVVLFPPLSFFYFLFFHLFSTNFSNLPFLHLFSFPSSMPTRGVLV